MTKANIRWALFSTLIMLSIFSFIFINTVQVEPTSTERIELREDLTEDKDQPEVNLPDLEVVKKILEKGRKILTSV